MRRLLLTLATLATLGAALAATASGPAITSAGALGGGALGALLAGTGGPAVIQLLKTAIPDRWVPDGISPAGNVALTAAAYVMASLALGADPLVYLQHGLAVGGASTAMVSSSRLSRLTRSTRHDVAVLRAEYRRLFGDEPGRRSRRELVEDIRLGREYALKRGETRAEHDQRQAADDDPEQSGPPEKTRREHGPGPSPDDRGEGATNDR